MLTIRRATPGDVPAVYQLMHEAHGAMADKSQYITDELPYLYAHVAEEGYILLCEEDGTLLGFFMVCLPGLGKDNLGYYLGLPEEVLRSVAIMDSAAVKPEAQGRGIMGLLFREAVRQTEGEYRLLLGTVAEDNLPSRRNFEKCGFTVYRNITKPQGLTRLLMGRRGAPGETAHTDPCSP